MIKETSTCNYLMVVHTPRLCNDVAFQPPQDDFSNTISCRPVIPDTETNTWTMQKLEDRIQEDERIKALKERNPLRQIQDAAEGATTFSYKRPIIGGIEVGGQRLVGGEGRMIEPSVVVGGGKETFLATIFNWKGYAMSKEEMKKLQIYKPERVMEWKEDQKAKAEPGKKWRVDYIETPQGREFRWIVESDENEVEGKKGDRAGGEDMREKGGSKEGKKGNGREGSRERAKPQKDKAQEKPKPKGVPPQVPHQIPHHDHPQQNEAEEEHQEGSEEVYKDEL